MTEDDQVKTVRGIVARLTEEVSEMSDRKIAEALGKGALDDLFKEILDPDGIKDAPSIADFLLEHKFSATLMATIRHAITHNYSFGVTKEGQTGYVAPCHYQWFDGAVMFVESGERFSGRIGRYDGDKLKYMVAGREIEGPASIGPEDVEWITLEELRKRIAEAPRRIAERIEETLSRLRKLVEEEDNSESKYQELLVDNPRAFGLRFTDIERHQALDDENKPDFVATRIRDGCHDLIEVKPPFNPIFKADGDFRAEFLQAWDQAERYLNYASRERAMLRREKGLLFENPRCYLIAGHGVTGEERRKITEKEERDPAITVYTYEELAALMADTLEIVHDPPVE